MARAQQAVDGLEGVAVGVPTQGSAIMEQHGHGLGRVPVGGEGGGVAGAGGTLPMGCHPWIFLAVN